MAIDSVSSSSASVAQFQPRPQQSTLNSGTDNRAIQNSQEETGARIAQQQPDQGGAASGIVVTNQPPVNPPVRQLNPGPNDEQSGSSTPNLQNTTSERNQATTSQSNAGSALNYSASGAANTKNSIGPAGRNLSLSV